MNTIRTIVSTALCALLLAFSSSAQAQSSENRNSAFSRNLLIFNEIYKMLDLYYVDTLSADTAIRWAIDGMLSNVDPYTEYYPADDDKLKQMATGKYAGIGSIIRYHKGHDRVIIDEPYENTPSQDVGLRAGDVIISVDNKDIKGMMPTQVTNMLRGEAGTTFELRFIRPGETKERSVRITRRTIQVPSIPYYGMADEGIGYINLSSFTSGCAREVRHALIQLREQGAKSLVLDLRDNGGGSVNEAIDIVNLFIDKGIKVVYTKGKQASTNNEYYTTSDPLAPDMPLVVLVNGMSASASEIVSGALQDMDRAVIVGTKTYGKGLVQAIRDVTYRGELKITTGRYYIPSGRCIQAYQYNHDGSTKTIPDSLRNVFYTKAGRVVRDGGGIQPDSIVKTDTLPTMVYDLVQSDQFFDWATTFVNNHSSIAEPTVFQVTDSIYADFIEYMVNEEVTYNRRTDELMKVLRDVAEMEGYLKDAEEELKALEAKLARDTRKDLERMRKHIVPYIEAELITRYYHLRGVLRHNVPTDKGYIIAAGILNNPTLYNNILSNKAQ
ncbi:MAG: PDZ domain-containing protein [Bacteroidaceae bacterium]|nr:PDZ domain-containing protein [Bacteroidaceae bacterium]